MLCAHVRIWCALLRKYADIGVAETQKAMDAEDQPPGNQEMISYSLNYAPVSVYPHYPPPGAAPGKTRDLTFLS